MAKRDLTKAHSWLAAATVPLDGSHVAEHAYRERLAPIPHDTVVDVLDVYCKHCTRTYADAGSEPVCPAAPPPQ